MVRKIVNAIRSFFLMIFIKTINGIKATWRGITWLVATTFVDVVGIAGLSMLWYGLDLFDTSLAYVVVGGLLVAYAVKANK